AKDQGADDKVLLVGDGSAEFTKASGLELDLTARGLGLRCQRFAMIVDNGTVKSIEIDAAGAFEKTSAESVLSSL
ncbi:MAG: redoxin family protein, partial [Alphaproteobacteria bacterium]